jgi:hypothetical protein
MTTDNDKYEIAGGDAAWRAWLDICSVAGVRDRYPDLADGLNSHISATMTAALARSSWVSDEFLRDDPVSFFDSYFLLGSERGKAQGRKPLKQLYKYRMENEGIPLKELVCGVLFSPERGKIRDIVRDWIATIKGWRPHTITQSDGTRKVVWESASEKDEIASTRAAEYSFGLRLDADVLKVQISDVFSEMENELKLEKSKIALLLYMTAQGETLDNSVILERLGVGKSRAYTLKDKCVEIMADKLKKRDVRTDDIMFAKLLISSCKAILGSDLAKAIEGAEV